MDWITVGLAVGGRSDAADSDALKRAGVGAVLQLYGRERDPLSFPFADAALHLFVVDGEPLPPDTIRCGVAFIRVQRQQGRAVLVACGAGGSRSPVFVASYLHEEGMELLDAFRLILQARPQVLPHPVLLRSMVEYYHPPQSTQQLLLAVLAARKGPS